MTQPLPDPAPRLDCTDPDCAAHARSEILARRTVLAQMPPLRLSDSESRAIREALSHFGEILAPVAAELRGAARAWHADLSYVLASRAPEPTRRERALSWLRRRGYHVGWLADARTWRLGVQFGRYGRAVTVYLLVLTVFVERPRG